MEEEPAMARYRGPKGRINRALGSKVYENLGAGRAMERPGGPGASRRRARPSRYAIELREKQRIKHYYGMLERQFRRLREEAQRLPGNTAETLLMLCERRLDNVVRRAGLASTLAQARLGVVHGHFRLNGEKIDRPSYSVRQGDRIAVRDRASLQELYRGTLKGHKPELPAWLELDEERLELRVLRTPSAQETSLPVERTPLEEAPAGAR